MMSLTSFTAHFCGGRHIIPLAHKRIFHITAKNTEVFFKSSLKAKRASWRRKHSMWVLFRGNVSCLSSSTIPWDVLLMPSLFRCVKVLWKPSPVSLFERWTLLKPLPLCSWTGNRGQCAAVDSHLGSLHCVFEDRSVRLPCFVVVCFCGVRRFASTVFGRVTSRITPCLERYDLGVCVGAVLTLRSLLKRQRPCGSSATGNIIVDCATLCLCALPHRHFACVSG